MKNVWPAPILIACMAFLAHGGTLPRPAVSVGYLTLRSGMSHEDSSAVAWLKSMPHFSPRVLDLSSAQLDRPGVELIWIHIPDSVSYAQWVPSMQKLRSLAAFYRSGGKLLLTDCAAMIPHALGIESATPEMRSENITDDWLFDQKGIQGFRGHPAFDGLFGGTFLWDTDHDNTLYRSGYFGNNYPSEGKVAGIEKSYVVIESDNKLMIEYADGKGRAMAIGAFVSFEMPNAKRPHLERFLSNVIHYLVTGKGNGRPTYWLKADDKPRSFVAAGTPAPPAKKQSLEDLPSSGMLLTRELPQNNFFDVAGRRALVMGKENGGIDEVWVHPFRVLRDYQAGLVVGDSVVWLSALPVSVEIRPESFTRTYTTKFGALKEIVFPSLERAGAIVSYNLEAPRDAASLLVCYRCDLRWMWPYDERALGDVYYGDDTTTGALHVKDLSGNFYCVIGADRRPIAILSGQCGPITFGDGKLKGEPTGENQVYHAALYSLAPGSDHTLTVAIVGTDEGRKRAIDDYRILLSHPRDEYTGLVRHYNDLLSRTVTIESPDGEFNALWKWALVGVDRFVTTTPGLGTALVAGFSTVDRGWDGGHKISGRPGYAWYFGRDSEWSGFAIDDYGDYSTVRQQIEFLQKYQDLTGKIFHEISTSGIVHYDASDATPLYIILAAHYLRASGDVEFVRKSWPHIEKAMEFLYSTDTDGDLLIENTNVGHGWVEGGKLWPVHTEFYLAGIWAQALSDASWMASVIGKKELGTRYGRDAAAVKKKVDDDFWNPATEVYNYGKLKDGSYNPEPTVLPAPVMYFGWLDDVRALAGLTRYCGENFSCDWGTRIVSDASPLFSPQGYHYGSVWPLFTGWTALAEYEYGRSAQGFSHILNNMYIKNHWAYGFVQEVMNGAVYRPSGVCPHQCWSETNILHPGIHGMIGWRPLATEKAATLAPRFPLHWDHVGVRNLRVGSSVIDFWMQRTLHKTTYRLTLRKGGPVTIDLAPEIPEGMDLIGGSLNGRGIRVDATTARGVLAHPIRLSLSDTVRVELIHAGGVGVVPVISKPSPGDSSRGARILGAFLNGLEYHIEVEGRSGSAALITAVVLDQKVLDVDGGIIVGEGGEGRVAIGVKFEPSAQRYERKQIVVRLQEIAR